ncbi:polysaccharide export outer membrane protein [Rhodobacter aestuarii]|uniref:Polysaccharide export outer membrane protein n=2 Tax=Rhodobacter group TaxID=3374108 RepID=A0A1N7IY80_9RHOB|nr:polysaccharide export outer membrane protein [Rhodobacter aestuarii]SIS42053.1 polysaccharide export outer membrane protein [Rhodobacter aestuarii]
MRLIMTALLSGTVLVGPLSGCGVVYHSSSVSPGVSAEGKVRVLPLTAESVMVANAAPYQPRELPSYFRQTAGLSGSMSAPIAAPDAAFDRVTRPGRLDTRLPPPATTPNYRIGIGDVVLLATPQAGSTVEQLTGILAAQTARQGYTVQDDGSISVPTVGRVQIAGQTVDDAEATLFQRFLDKQIDPTFSLEITEFNSKKVAIGGDVSNPGIVPVTLQPLHLDEALAAVGGVKSADLDTAVVRIYRSGKLYQVPLKSVYEKPEIGRMSLLAGDSLFVDTAYELDKAAAYFEEQIKLAEFKQAERQSRLQALQTEIGLRRSELQERRDTFATRLELGAEARDYAYITGEISKQTRYALPYDRKATLADAIYDAGGGLDVARSNLKEIYVLRGSSDPMEYESITAWHLDARNAAAMLLATRFELHANDVIFVATQPVRHWGNVVNAITPSLIVSSVNAASN